MAEKEIDIGSTRTWLLDYDNCSNTDSAQHINILVVQSAYWKVLTENLFCNVTLKAHFETLNQEQREDFFKFGIACLCTFVQANCTGPDLDEEIAEYLSSEELNNVDHNKTLAVNNEDINVNTKFPCLLVASQLIFKNCQIEILYNLWWQWRGILVHQKILDELSPTLLSNADNLQKEIKELNIIGNLRVLFEIEQAQLYCEFRSTAKAYAHIKTACLITGLKFELFGKLGRRTKYQTKDLAQLTLEVSLSERPELDRTPVENISCPQNVSLTDDIRLDTIEFAEASKGKSFPDLEQKLLLLVAQHMTIATPQDDLFYEEVKPFIDLILMQNNTWCVRVCTLLLRCKLEAKHNRTIERSLMQCEEIINCIRKPEPHVLNRIGGVFSTGVTTIWRAEEQYADLMLNLGLIKAAVEVYLRLQLWEEVIVCYTILKMRHKAAEIIKAQLDIKPTVKLYCLLGDATDDVTCYEKAWEFSKRRSHRAQRHWGQYYFMRKKYLECISHFEKSVSINPLQGMVWLRLGFAALETQNWQVAATAYRRYTCLEPDGFEAWNNLAQAYLKLGNKRNAHHALQDAIRCNFDNWKVWENFLVVSAEIGNYTDLIRAYHKLLDLKEKYLNPDILKELTYGVTNEQVDPEMKGSSQLMKRARELLGRITAIYPADGTLWELYAYLAPVPLLKVQRFQRAYRGFTQGGNWMKEVSTCKHVLYLCLKLGEAVLDDSINANDAVIYSVKLNVSSAISAIKKMEYPETKELLQEVTSVLARIIEKAKNASSDCLLAKSMQLIKD